jgi:hypothetical protein
MLHAISVLTATRFYITPYDISNVKSRPVVIYIYIYIYIYATSIFRASSQDVLSNEHIFLIIIYTVPDDDAPIASTSHEKSKQINEYLIIFVILLIISITNDKYHCCNCNNSKI